MKLFRSAWSKCEKNVSFLQKYRSTSSSFSSNSLALAAKKSECVPDLQFQGSRVMYERKSRIDYKLFLEITAMSSHRINQHRWFYDQHLK